MGHTRIGSTSYHFETRPGEVVITKHWGKGALWLSAYVILVLIFGLAEDTLSFYCDQRMRLRAVVLPPATLKILRGLQAACRAPPGADAMAG